MSQEIDSYLIATQWNCDGILEAIGNCIYSSDDGTPP